ncbi:MAG TPA: Ig-like domain-containing protein [Longimicrobiales bacterium]|nr:Ig-like domain-containing protein [Longimicrobiales bacterium]
MLRTTLRTTPLVALLAMAIACDSGTEPPIPAEIELTADVDVLPAGQTRQLEVLVRDENGNAIQNPSVSYQSSSQGVATVSSTGLVTGVGHGMVTITATAGAVSDQVSLEIFDIGDLCTNALGLQVGETVRASLQPGDCTSLVDDGSFADIWFFQLAQQTTVTVSMTSEDLDAYLFLIDEATGEDFQDDDSGGGTNARIQVALVAGTYLILANTYPGEQGSYTLSVTASTTADPALRTGIPARDREVGALRLRKR